MKKLPLLKYFLFLIPSALIMMLLWSVLVNGNLYYCSDKVPFLDFIPPFVHESFTGDYYIATQSFVWTIWILFIGAIFLIPFISIRLLNSAKK